MTTVAVSIKPLQSIVANLTDGLNYNIELVVDKNQSLHNFQLKPSKVKLLHNANIIILIDKNFEMFLRKVVSSLDQEKQEIIEIAKFNGVFLQTNNDRHTHAEHEHHDHDVHQHHPSDFDYHIWLDPEIIKTVASEMVNVFVQRDPANEVVYRENLRKFIKKLDQLDSLIERKIEKIKNENFIVTHNAYNYFIYRYGMKTPQSITIDHDHNIGAKKFLNLTKQIKQNAVKCVFEEPQFSSKIIEKLKEDSNIKLGILDAEWGNDKIELKDVYFNMLEEIANSFEKCLQ